jgi:hypothetical protein
LTEAGTDVILSGRETDAMLKRIADLLEKVSAGSFLVALYQSSTHTEGYAAMCIGMATGTLAIYLSRGGIK